MWYKLTEKDPPESTSMNTVLFPVWFHGGLCLARKIGEEVNVNGSPSNFADEELLSEEDHQAKRIQFAEEDYEDLMKASVIISFTEQPRSKNSRGDRHDVCIDSNNKAEDHASCAQLCEGMPHGSCKGETMCDPNNVCFKAA